MKRAFYSIMAALAAIASAAALTLTWDPNPAEDQVTSYQVYQATNVAGPYTLIGSTTNTSFTLPLPPGRYFFYVTASNFWTESSPSQTVSTPPLAAKVATPKIAR